MIYVIHVNIEEKWVIVVGSKKRAMEEANKLLDDTLKSIKFIDRFKVADAGLFVDNFPNCIVVEKTESYYNGA